MALLVLRANNRNTKAASALQPAQTVLRMHGLLRPALLVLRVHVCLVIKV